MQNKEDKLIDMENKVKKFNMYLIRVPKKMIINEKIPQMRKVINAQIQELQWKPKKIKKKKSNLDKSLFSWTMKIKRSLKQPLSIGI